MAGMGTDPYVKMAGGHSASTFGGAERLQYIIGATNMATPGIMAVSAGFANLTAVGMRTAAAINDAMSVTSAGLMALGGVAALAIGAATVVFAQFEKQMKMVQAVSGDMTNNELARMGDQIKTLAMKYGESADEIAKAMQVVGRAGLSEPAAQMSVFADALKMAKIEGMDLTQAIEGLIQTTSLFGADISKPQEFATAAKQTAEDLIHASQISPTSVADLEMGLKYVGGSADVARMPRKDILAALSYMSTKGVTGETAGTSLRGFISKQAMQQPEVLKALSSIGLNPDMLWTNGGNTAKPIWEQVKIINDHMEAQGLSQMEKIGLWSKISMQKTSQQMLKIDPNEMKGFYAKMQEQFDVEKQVAIAMDSAIEQFNRLKASVEVTLINVGEKAIVFLRPAIEGFQQFFEWVSKSNEAGAVLAAVLGTLAVGGALVVLRWAGVAVKYMAESYRMAGESAASLGSRLLGMSGPATAAADAQKILYTRASEVGLQFDKNRKLSDAYAKSMYGQIAAIEMVGAREANLGGGRGSGASRGLAGPRTFSEYDIAASTLLGSAAASGDPLDVVAKNRKTAMKEIATLENEIAEHSNAIWRNEAAISAGLLSDDVVEGMLKKNDDLEAKIKTKKKRQSLLADLTESVYGITDIDLAKSQPGRMDRLKKSLRGGWDKLIGSVAPEKGLLAKSGLVKVKEGSTIAEAGLAGLASSLTTILPLLAAVAVVAATMYVVWKDNQIAIAKAQKEYDDSWNKLQKNQTYLDAKERVKQLNQELDKVPEYKQAEIKLKIKAETELINSLQQDAVDKGRELADTKRKNPYAGGILDNVPQQTSQGPVLLGQNWWGNTATGGKFDTFGYSQWSNPGQEYYTMQSGWVEIKKATDALDYLEANKENIPNYNEKRNEILSTLDKFYGSGVEETKLKQEVVAYSRQELFYEYLSKKEGEIYWKMVRLQISQIGRIISLLFGGTSYSQLTTDTNKNTAAQKNNSSAIVRTTEKIRQQNATFVDAIAKWAWSIDMLDYTLAGWELKIDHFKYSWNKFFVELGLNIAKVMKVFGMADQKDIDYMQGELNSLKKEHGAKMEAYGNLVKPDLAAYQTAYRNDWNNQSGIYFDVPTYGTDLSTMFGDKKAGEAGDGSGSGSGKERLLKDGYNIDFILCSKKRLPDLDPKLFKNQLKVNLDTKKFDISNVHINTRDKPENIEKGFRKAIINISESNEV